MVVHCWHFVYIVYILVSCQAMIEIFPELIFILFSTSGLIRINGFERHLNAPLNLLITKLLVSWNCGLTLKAQIVNCALLPLYAMYLISNNFQVSTFMIIQLVWFYKSICGFYIRPLIRPKLLSCEVRQRVMSIEVFRFIFV